ncbi:transposase, partial [Catenulispora rubra]|uniref:transposase n=1 Tax=Catenulispora rubra TaxID=280293 RepID=UPI001E60282C
DPMAPPRKYPPELRERAVQMYRSTRPRPVVRRLAEQLGVHPEALRTWIRADAAARGEKPDRHQVRPAKALPTDDLEELLMLRQQNSELERECQDLRRANEILKVASAFFAQELDPIRRRY